jgi:hypothetical protein
VILGSELDTGRYVSAELKFRAKPNGIQKIISVLSSQGEVISQSTKAEDLAAPIEDSAKKLAMLIDYRSKLEALLGHANNTIDTLIKVNKELAQVQSDIEALTGQRTHLLQRVETEILNVTISSIHNRSFWKPILIAFSEFGSDFSKGVSGAITGIAYLIPWGLTLLAFIWIGRILWSHWKRPKINA